MYLTKVSRIYKGTSRKVRMRYIIFLRHESGYLWWPSYGESNEGLLEEKWLNEKFYRPKELSTLISMENTRYPSGWHVFLLEDAKRFFSWVPLGGEHIYFVVRKVKCRGLLATGVEDKVPVEVYKYIKIEKEKNNE